MEQNAKTALFEDYPIPKAVASLTIPTILSSLVMVIYNIADTYFVGLLNDPIQNAAVTLAAPVLLAFNAVNNLFGVGSSSVMSRALGRKDYDTVKQGSAFGFYCALFSGILFSLLCFTFEMPLLRLLGTDGTTLSATRSYMRWTVLFGAVPSILNVVFAYLVRAEGASLHASVGTMSGCLLNIILDPFFIMPWGLNLGAAGAGLATFLSNCAACLYFLILIFCRRKSTFVCIHPKMLVFGRDLVLGVCSVGIPASIQNLLNVTGMTILNNFTAGYGSDAVAAMGIAQKIQMVPMQIALGGSQGIMPLVSYNYASGNRKRMKDSVMFVTRFMLGFMAVVVLTGIFGAGTLIHLFIDNENVIRHGIIFLRGLMLALPFLCMDFMAVGVFQAIGSGKRALIFAVLRKIVLEIPAIILLNLIVPLYGMAFAQFVAEFVLAIAAVIMLNQIFQTKSLSSKRESKN